MIPHIDMNMMDPHISAVKPIRIATTMHDADPPPPSTDPIPADAVRRVPVQARSRERVERMLAAASELLVEDGSDRMRMTEVAARSGVSIGSLYQYFPDKSAVLRTLAVRYNAQGQACIRDELEGLRTGADLAAALARLVDGYYRMFLEHPVMLAIWSGAQADPELAEVEADDVRACGALIEDAFRRVSLGLGESDLRIRSLLIAHLTNATVRLAVTLGRDEGDRIVATFRDSLSRGFLTRE